MAAVRRWSFWMPAQDHGFLRRVLSWRRAFLTRQGTELLVAAGIAVLFAAGGPTNLGFLLPGLALGGLAAGLLLGALFRPRIEATRELPLPPTAGGVLRYRIRVRNMGAREVRGLSVTEGLLPVGLRMVPEAEGGSASIEHLAAGEEASVTLALHCPERGAFELGPLRAGSSYPSGLIRVAGNTGTPKRLVVHPSFTPQHELEIPAGRRYQPGGIVVSSSVGDSTEFWGTRDYRHGDRIRDIHWASYARTGRLIVKENREEYFVRVGIVLDTALARRERPASLECRISLAAGIADALARRDHIIDLLAAGERLYRLQAGRALARLDNVLELLACVDASPRVDFGMVRARLAEEAGRLSACVFLLGDWDAARADACRGLRETGTGVRAVVVRDGATTLPPEPGVVVVPSSHGMERVR